MKFAFWLFCVCIFSMQGMISSVMAEELLPQRHLIVAPERFHESPQSYVAHKQKQLPTQLVSLESILKDSAGIDDAERLKRYLYAQWKSKHIGYVLLVGDADVMPVRYMVLDRVTKPAFDYAFYPSDLYYSDLAKRDGSLDDWNSRKDSFHANYFGEVRGEANKDDAINFDDIDYRPEVAVGRWPVSTIAEVSIVADKVMAYESSILGGEKPGMKNAALFSVGGWVDSRDVMDGVGNGLGPNWSIDKRYYSSRGRESKNLPTSKALVQLLNEGVGLAIHAGHGQDDQWEQCFPSSSLDKLNNHDRLPIVISAGCSTARFATLPPYEAYVDVDGTTHRGTNAGEVFDAPPPAPACYQSGSFNPTGLGEQLLRRDRNGAVAYIGCNTGSQPCGLTLLTGFSKTYESTPNSRLGDCWVGAVGYYYREQRLADLKPNNDWYPPSIFFQAMKFMCFGDPTTVMPAK